MKKQWRGLALERIYAAELNFAQYETGDQIPNYINISLQWKNNRGVF